jgi:hypothetical protein
MRVIMLGAVLLVLAVSAGSGGAVRVSGSAILNSGGLGSVNSVSCGAPGDCVAGGSYKDGRGPNSSQAFAVSETAGSWGDAMELPGTAWLNAGDEAEVDSVSCAAPGDCSAGGYYTDGRGKGQAFVVSEKNGS